MKMGKHTKKSKTYRKAKKDRKYSSSSDSSSEEWVEKQKGFSSQKRGYSSESDSSSELKLHEKGKKNGRSSSSEECARNSKHSHRHGSSDDSSLLKKAGKSEENVTRDEWMSLSTSFSSSSNWDKRKAREERKRTDREGQQYNPRDSIRELNPYWKDGGDGLPKFQKPSSDDEDYSRRESSGKLNWSKPKADNRSSNWRKPKQESKSSKEECSTRTTLRRECNEESLKMDNKPQDDGNETSEKELNQLAARIVKAEIMGNIQLASELKEKLENARNSLNSTSKSEEVVLTHTDAQGRTQPVKLQSEYGESSGKKKKQRIDTHKDGQRVKYFADDDKYSLRQMFENEKYNSVEDHNREFLRMVKKVPKNDDLDDIFSDNIRKQESDSKIDSRNRDRAISEHQKVSRSLDTCNKCIQSEQMLKHLMVSMSETVYISLPAHQPLTEQHCLISPVRHVPCSTQLDENEWSDILDMRRSLVKMFQRKDEDIIFFECALGLHRFPHMTIECVPLPKEAGDLAPIYFKKAIDECEAEWAQNKKLVSLKGRDVRKAIPKGLPYFCVSFGMEEGYAHVIEDEQLFPVNFAQEIIGGMLDLHHSKWRKPKTQSFQEQSKRVLDFSKEWKDFDCTVAFGS